MGQQLNVIKFKLNQPALIEASAGTGKTYTITNLVLRILLGVGEQNNSLARPLLLDDLLIVTFTNVATADLKRRIYERIRTAHILFENFLDIAKQDLLIKIKEQLFKQLSEYEVGSPEWLDFLDQLNIKPSMLKWVKVDGSPVAVDEALKIEQALLQVQAHEAHVEHLADEDLSQDDALNQDDALSQDDTVSLAEGNFSNLTFDLNEDGAAILSSGTVILDPASFDEDVISLFLQEDKCAPEFTKQLEQYKINIDDIVLNRLQCKDDFLLQLLKQVAAQNALQEAIAVLIQAERTIDNAAICTIHSFCNRTLNQIYAFEANEAFTSELSVDLSFETEQAENKTWRQLFYRLNASPAVLRALGICSPNKLDDLRDAINSVRLSQEQDGVFGYQLLNFHIPGLRAAIDLSQDYTVQDLIVRLSARMDLMIYAADIIQCLIYIQWQQAINFDELTYYLDLEQEKSGPGLSDAKGKPIALVKNGTSAVCGLHLFEQIRTAIDQDDDMTIALAKSLHLLDGVDINSLSSQEANELLTSLKATKVDALLGDLVSKIQKATSNMLESDIDYGKTLIRSNNSKLKDASVQRLHQNIGELVQKLRHNANQVTELKPVLLTLLSMQINQQLQELCDEHHLMGNDDLLLRLDQALQRKDFGERLAHVIRKRYPLAMIDEFQDTDPVQYSIFSRIYLNQEALEDKAYCYLIGDPKQSIYAFRGSDINSYLKARNEIKDLTDNQGLRTLTVNYRSAEDVIEASNALFGRKLNADNASPFKERDIQFHPVGVSYKRNLTPIIPEGMTEQEFKALPVDSITVAQAWGVPFVIEHLQDDGLLLQARNSLPNLGVEQHDVKVAKVAEQSASESQQDSSVGVQESSEGQQGTSANQQGSNVGVQQESEVLMLDGQKFDMHQALANTYIVCFDKHETKTDDQNGESKNAPRAPEIRKKYAQSAAIMIKKVLDHGYLVSQDSSRRIKPSDIAILVRSSSENQVIQNELQSLGISSVYFSDQSSVLLEGKKNPTAESLDLLYLMEAMCDYANRSKVMRVLGSGLLRLHAEEFLEHIEDENFEQEVLVLRRSAEIWEKSGFMPAFQYWCSAPEHQVTARLLSIINGERILTNYAQLSELIQAAHNRYSSTQSQLRWFYDTLYSEQNSFDADATQKRLESEHDQIKILTIHKSKGLEFPIVFMPFLWLYKYPATNDNLTKKMLAKYYSSEVEHMVLDYDLSHKIKIPNELDLARARIKAQEAKQQALANHKVESTNKQASVSEVVTLSEVEVATPSTSNQDQAKALASVESEVQPLDSNATKAQDSKGTKGQDGKKALASQDADAPESESAEQIKPYLFMTPSELEIYEEDKEYMRLLYVAMTRARVANFYFIFEHEPSKRGRKGRSSALMALLSGFSDADNSNANVLARLKQYPELFTMINGSKCIELFEEELKLRHALAPKLAMSSASPINQVQAQKIQQRMDKLLEVALQEGQQFLEQDHGQWSRLELNGKRTVFSKAPYQMFNDVPLGKESYRKLTELSHELQLTKVDNLPVPLDINTEHLDSELASSDSLLKQKLQHGEITPKRSQESCAMSFAYKGAIDRGFNIMSYTKITSGHDPIQLSQEGETHVAKRNEDEDGAVDAIGWASGDPNLFASDDALYYQYSSEWLGKVGPTGLGSLVGGNLCTLEEDVRQAQLQAKVLFRYTNAQVLENTNPVEILNTLWTAGYNGFIASAELREKRFHHEFPRGAEAGTFLHEILRMVDFENLHDPEKRILRYLNAEIKEELLLRLDLKPFYYKIRLNECFPRLVDWMVDILEAPIIQGTYQCLALADLTAKSYAHEMNFLMTTQRFNTHDIDVLCQDMARKLLPVELQSLIDIEQLKLREDELFGFITGSLDVACRFDLDFRDDLEYRATAMNNMSYDLQMSFKDVMQRKGCTQMPQVNEQPNYKYYVIDYKSNVLGDKFEDYSTNNMLKAIYEHRYDVQFLFYTLALYRHLKLRLALKPDADYEELKQFYDEHVGGVIYMYMRGLRADFTRKHISTGVFSARIDFDFVYRLDKIFGFGTKLDEEVHHD